MEINRLMQLLQERIELIEKRANWWKVINGLVQRYLDKAKTLETKVRLEMLVAQWEAENAVFRAELNALRELVRELSSQ